MYGIENRRAPRPRLVALGGFAIVAMALGACTQTVTRTVYVNDPNAAQTVASGGPVPAGTTVVETTSSQPIIFPPTSTATSTSTGTTSTGTSGSRTAGSGEGRDPNRGGGGFGGGGPGDTGGWGG